MKGESIYFDSQVQEDIVHHIKEGLAAGARKLVGHIAYPFRKEQTGSGIRL